MAQTSHVSLGDVAGHLVPSGGSDVTPPSVTVLSPDGAESFAAGGTQPVTWMASDPSGVDRIEIFLSDDGGASWRPVARDLPNDGAWSWFVPNRPGAAARIRVRARDGAGNRGQDDSGDDFTIIAVPAGFVPTTLRDFDLPGTQPLVAGTLDDPSVSCVSFHGDYDAAVEPWHGWRGSMMGQAMRDPLFLACLAVAEQDAPSVGDLCLRCHTPGGWQEGRSVDTSGGQLTVKDRHGVQCDFCHRAVDPVYRPGVSPAQDLPILDPLEAIPLAYANGQFVTDPAPRRRGPGWAPTLEVTVTNESAHKFPSGYPEGRRAWIQVRAVDAGGAVIWQSGAYDAASGVLTHDEDLRIYHIDLGISRRLAPVLGLPAGPSFHFVLNDSVCADTRIPPRGFAHAAFAAIQSPPVGAAYADGQYWDTAAYTLPSETALARVTLYYQSTSKEYVEFLRDENHTNAMGQLLYDASAAHGRSAPVAIRRDSIAISPPTEVAGLAAPARSAILAVTPNPGGGSVRIEFSLGRTGSARLAIYDIHGRLVRSLFDRRETPGRKTSDWDGFDDRRARVSPGVYLCRLEGMDATTVRKFGVVR